MITFLITHDICLHSFILTLGKEIEIIRGEMNLQNLKVHRWPFYAVFLSFSLSGDIIFSIIYFVE